MYDLSLNDYINDICRNIINTIINTAYGYNKRYNTEKVISEEDFDKLLTLEYKTLKNETSIIECPISFTTFEDDTLVTSYRVNIFLYQIQ